MKNIVLLLLLVSQTAIGQTAGKTEAYKFILDYAVPSSPAFTALDINPQKVTRGSSAKPLVLNGFSNFLQSGKLDPGISADFSPYILLGGGFQNLDEYRKNPYKRMLANSMVSVGVLKNSKDSANTDFGLGARITFFDDHDLFSNDASAITDKIGSALARAASAPVSAGQIPDDEVGTSSNITQTVPVDLSRFYTDAFNEIRKKKGWALSAGYGFRATARSSVLKGDSLSGKQSKLWISSTRYTTGGFDIYGTVQGTFPEESSSSWIAGLAVGGKNKLSNFGAELIYDFANSKWNYGANFEIRLLRQFSYLISLNRSSFLVNGKDAGTVFRVLSGLRLDLFGH